MLQGNILGTLLVFLITTAACSGARAGPEQEISDLDAFEGRLESVFSEKPRGTGSVYKLMKDGLAGQSWLGTFSGYENNRLQCQLMADFQNNGPGKSVLPGSYFCREIPASGTSEATKDWLARLDLTLNSKPIEYSSVAKMNQKSNSNTMLYITGFPNNLNVCEMVINDINNNDELQALRRDYKCTL